MAVQSAHKTRERNYPVVFREDFDRSKEFEDVAVRLLNEMNVVKVQNPEGWENFPSLYPNQTSHHRTLFLDLEDTLIYVTMFPLDGSHKRSLISFSDDEISIMKVG